MNNKAILLYSGGLDSLLAAHIAASLHIEFIALFIKTPFYQKDTEKICNSLKNLSVKIHVLELKEDYFEIVKSPNYGYGKNLNPCIDCRILMFKKAKELMKKENASFLITGEVLNQRPMSQKSISILRFIEKKAGLDLLVLRPLSSKLLPETLMEKNGMIDREKLFAISGRSRKKQMALALVFGIENYETPAGGCLLTEKHYCNRLKHLLNFGSEFVADLSRLGRHFLINDNILIVARNEHESTQLVNFKKYYDFFECTEKVGTSGLLLKPADERTKLLCTSIVLRYSKKAKNILYTSKDKEEILNVAPIDEKELLNLIVGVAN